MCIVCKPVSPCSKCMERRRFAARRGVSVFGKLTSDDGRAKNELKEQEKKTSERREKSVDIADPPLSVASLWVADDSVEEEEEAEDVSGTSVEELSVPRLCRLLESSLSGAKASRLRCSRLLVPLGLVRRAARALLAASASEPCGLHGARVQISVTPSTAAAAAFCSSRRHNDDEDAGYWEEELMESDDDGGRRTAVAVTWDLPLLSGPCPWACAAGGDWETIDGDSGSFGDSGFYESGMFGSFHGCGKSSSAVDVIGSGTAGQFAPTAAEVVEPTFHLTLELSEEEAGLAERSLAGLRSLLSPGTACRGSVRLAAPFRVRKQRLYEHKKPQQVAEEED